MRKLAARYALVALSFMGSAILLFSCEDRQTKDTAAGDERMMTEYSEDLSVVMSQNGRRSYHFVTPLLEGYSLAREPYREFRKGVKITTYKNDSLTEVDVVLTANYAIYYENRELWEAKGNVVAEKSDGKTLYTQQLFWNARTKKIYSNVDSKIVQSGGRDVFIGEGFESDEEFKDWRFRRMKGRMEVNVTPTELPDSAAVASPDRSAENPSEAAAADRTSEPAVRPAPDGRLRHGSAGPTGSRAGSAAGPRGGAAQHSVSERHLPSVLPRDDQGMMRKVVNPDAHPSDPKAATVPRPLPESESQSRATASADASRPTNHNDHPATGK